MKSVLIIENNNNPLMVKENVDPRSKYTLEGVFTEFDIKNRNERIYTAQKFIPCLNELNERMTTMGVVYGEFDHPDVFDMSLSRASHIITKAKYVKESNRVEGGIKLLSTYWGKEARSLVDDGCPIFVSSRAAGVTESDGTVSLKKLFTYDVVADPGFASAKMNSVNESFGFTESPSTNFRIYDLSNESKTNELFKMNNNDFVTKKQLSDYSDHIVEQIAITKKEVRSALKSGNMNPKKLEKLLEYYENLQESHTKMVTYLDYLAEQVQVVVNENKSLKSTTNKLINHNDYLAENLEKTINYTEYIAENLDKNISYSEYLAENLDKNISYSEYIAENLDKNISYSEYLAENLDKNISYSEYLAENLDKNISYSEYLAENLDKNISYSEYIAEHLDNNIAYSEYLAENLEGSIEYAEYIAESLDDTINYTEYIAENLDKTVGYAGMIAEKLNNTKGKVFENMTDAFPTLDQVGFEEEVESDEDNEFFDEEEFIGNEDQMNLDEVPSHVATNDVCVGDGCIEGDEEVINIGEPDPFGSDENTVEEEDQEFVGESDSALSLQIDKLIEEAKKRKVSESNDLHFLNFLNKSQANSYYDLSAGEQEQVKLYLNEKSYFSSSEVLKLMSEALEIKNESLEERVTRLMPENIKPIWGKLNESSKKSIMSQARLYTNLDTDLKVEHFWNTRNFKVNESVTKKLISQDSLIQEDKLSTNEIDSIMKRFKNL